MTVRDGTVSNETLAELVNATQDEHIRMTERGGVNELYDFSTAEILSILTELQSRRSVPSEPVAWRREYADPHYQSEVTQWKETAEVWAEDGFAVTPLYPSPASKPEVTETEAWRTMDSAPLDGKHCILAVKEGAFVYSVQGAYDGKQWNCVHRGNVKPLYWMPNIRLPEGWQELTPALSAIEVSP